MSENQQSLEKYLEVISGRERHYHDALWEAEKHYTWWVYILFGGLIYLYTSFGICNIFKFVLILFVSLFGMWISFAAINAIRRDGEAFCVAHQMFQRAIIALGLAKQKRNLPRNGILYEEAKGTPEWLAVEEVKSGAKNCGFRKPSFSFSIRYIFWVTFWVTLGIFGLSTILSVVTLICPSISLFLN
jgi:hypothetical protein